MGRRGRSFNDRPGVALLCRTALGCSFTRHNVSHLDEHGFNKRQRYDSARRVVNRVRMSGRSDGASTGTAWTRVAACRNDLGVLFVREAREFAMRLDVGGSSDKPAG